MATIYHINNDIEMKVKRDILKTYYMKKQVNEAMIENMLQYISDIENDFHNHSSIEIKQLILDEIKTDKLKIYSLQTENQYIQQLCDLICEDCDIRAYEILDEVKQEKDENILMN